MEPLQPLNPGDRFQPSASWYNATIEVIKEYFKGRQREQAEGPDFRVVQIQNKSGLALHNCSIVGIGEILVDPADSTRFKSSTGFESAAPTAAGLFAVLQEPARIDGFANAVMSGETWALVSVSNSSHTFAKPINGDYDKLQSQAAAGPARIVWKEDGTGVKWAYVLIDPNNNAAGGGGSTTISSDPTSETADGPDYVFTASVENNLPTPGQDYFYVTASTDTIDLKQQRYKDGNYGIDGAFVIGNAVVSGIAEFGCPPDGGIDWSNPHLMGGARLQQFEGNIDSPNAPTFDIPVSEGSGSGKKQCLSQLCASFLFDDPDSETDIPVALYFVTMCREEGVTGGVDVAGYWYGAVVSPGSHQADFLPRFFYQDGFAPSTGYPTFKEGVTGTHEGIEYIGGHRVGGSLDVDNLAYTPATSSNWGSSPPSTVVDAIDAISAIVNAHLKTGLNVFNTVGSVDQIVNREGNYQIKCYGGGGGGGGGFGGTGGDGGGSGEYASETVALRIGDVITIIVGVGGTGGTAGNSGQDGSGTSVLSRSGSSFTTVTANGGLGGAPAGIGTSGLGGTGSTNTTHTNGNNGTTGNGTVGGSGGASLIGGGSISGGTGSNAGTSAATTAGGGGGGPTNGVGGTGGIGYVTIEQVP